MAVKDILSVVTSAKQDEACIAFASDLARRSDAHLTTLLINWMPALPAVVEGWIVDARWGELVEESRKVLKSETEALEVRMRGEVDRCTVASSLIEPEAARSVLATYARHADLVVVPRPLRPDAGDARSVIVEGILFSAGRPVMVVPPAWRKEATGTTVMVCWDAGREAARALADAMPFIHDAGRVVIVTADAKTRIEGHGEMPGADIALHLARHGVKVEVRNADTMSRRTAQALLDEARAVDAGLIVMGGYGHSRMTQFMFGGVTRDMLAEAHIPILMSH